MSDANAKYRKGKRLRLDANEGRCVLSAGQLASLLDGEIARRYPDASVLEKKIADRLGIASDLVIATAGADDALDRAVRMLAGPGSTIATTVPSFGEYADAATRSGAYCISVERGPGDSFPLGSACAMIRDSQPAMFLLASPDNPGGGILTEEEFEVLSSVCSQSGTILLVDLTYDDFSSDRRLRERVLASPGVVVTGSFSKSFGLAGFRVGWAAVSMDSASLMEDLRRAGPPFSLSAPAIAAACMALETDPAVSEEFFKQVRSERTRLFDALGSAGAEPFRSEANFICAHIVDAPEFVRALEVRGILVRHWPGRRGFEGLARITCPGCEDEFQRLLSALDDIGRLS